MMIARSLIVSFIGTVACSLFPTSSDATTAKTRTSVDFDDRSQLAPPQRTGDVGIRLPAGFEATLFAELDAPARHLIVRSDGVVYVRLKSGTRGTVVALADRDGDGVAEEQERFGASGGTGILIDGDHLYYSTNDAVFRRRFEGKALVPGGKEESVLSGLPAPGGHDAKALATDGKGHLFTMVGAPSNACMQRSRVKGSPGQRPCPQLDQHGSIWRFETKPGQRFPADTQRHATGLRQVVALSWHGGELYAVQHGRDQLHSLFPERFTKRQSAELPAEEFLVLPEGFVGGWPYTYYDWRKDQRMLAPEYGGDGTKKAERDYPDPLVAFPGHYAPNALLFYEADAFPAEYRGAAFVAFHGSWNRAPFPQRGYHVAVVPFADGKPGKPRVFMDGFAGKGRLRSSSDAVHRPCGLALGPLGELYVSDDRGGYIWQVRYTGE